MIFSIISHKGITNKNSWNKSVKKNWVLLKYFKSWIMEAHSVFGMPELDQSDF